MILTCEIIPIFYYIFIDFMPKYLYLLHTHEHFVTSDAVLFIQRTPAKMWTKAESHLGHLIGYSWLLRTVLYNFSPPD